MEFKRIGPNLAEIQCTNGTRILFSYDDAVAAHVAGEGYIKTKYTMSRTTGDHVKKWLGGSEAHFVSQDVLDMLAREVR